MSQERQSFTILLLSQIAQILFNRTRRQFLSGAGLTPVLQRDRPKEDRKERTEEDMNEEVRIRTEIPFSRRGSEPRRVLSHRSLGERASQALGYQRQRSPVKPIRTRSSPDHIVRQLRCSMFDVLTGQSCQIVPNGKGVGSCEIVSKTSTGFARGLEAIFCA